jgi:hypothetical protein
MKRMKNLPITNRQKEVVGYVRVDEADYQRYRNQRWSMSGAGYVQGWDGENVRHLHRMILELPVGDPRVVDHINGDKLDNRRSNLRIADVTLNNRNLHGPRKTSTSGALYVHPNKRPDGSIKSYSVRVGGQYICSVKTIAEGEAIAARVRKRLYGLDQNP